MSDERLLPCPFCGGEAMKSCFPTDYPTEHCRAYVQCVKCEAMIKVDGRDTKAKEMIKDVVEKWNRRAK